MIYTHVFTRNEVPESPLDRIAKVLPASDADCGLAAGNQQNDNNQAVPAYSRELPYEPELTEDRGSKAGWFAGLCGRFGLRLRQSRKAAAAAESSAGRSPTIQHPIS
ncbi:MAG: hypothetical protein NXI32_30890 [bacterium]|nr:hypothetical protein [bacterium]